MIQFNGPAIDIHGVKRWVNGNNFLHREDGPAVEYPDGSVSFWLYGIELNLKEQMKDVEFCERYPKLIELMVIDSLHSS